MKRCLSLILLEAVCLFSCGTEAPNESKIRGTESGKDTKELNVNESTAGDDIIGSWSLVLQAFDANGNKKLDDEERKKGDAARHFYQFNADGTCLIHTLKLKGSYEIKEEQGKKRLYTYIIDAGTKTPENRWYIISITKTELILLSQDQYAFWIYKRV